MKNNYPRILTFFQEKMSANIAMRLATVCSTRVLMCTSGALGAMASRVSSMAQCWTSQR